MPRTVRPRAKRRTRAFEADHEAKNLVGKAKNASIVLSKATNNQQVRFPLFDWRTRTSFEQRLISSRTAAPFSLLHRSCTACLAKEIERLIANAKMHSALNHSSQSSWHHTGNPRRAEARKHTAGRQEKNAFRYSRTRCICSYCSSGHRWQLSEPFSRSRNKHDFQ